MKGRSTVKRELRERGRRADNYAEEKKMQCIDALVCYVFGHWDRITKSNLLLLLLFAMGTCLSLAQSLFLSLPLSLSLSLSFPLALFLCPHHLIGSCATVHVILPGCTLRLHHDVLLRYAFVKVLTTDTCAGRVHRVSVCVCEWMLEIVLLCHRTIDRRWSSLHQNIVFVKYTDTINWYIFIETISFSILAWTRALATLSHYRLSIGQLLSTCSFSPILYQAHANTLQPFCCFYCRRRQQLSIDKLNISRKWKQLTDWLNKSDMEF